MTIGYLGIRRIFFTFWSLVAQDQSYSSSSFQLRTEAIDPAFQSRINMRIQYPPFQAVARRQIWVRHILGPHSSTAVNGDEFDQLKEIEMNGEEIKNVVRTVRLLASDEKKPS
ncbi:hypothetical protein F4823DRAFT_632952 [Ustulina deusta]|nr:hypothetical protein F4823DRAFT_632952 [Ustulina deusta]